jgi:uncharacterized protein (DUF362 family)
METVAFIRDAALFYSTALPFHPAKAFPEYPFSQISAPNPVYEAIRRLFLMLGMDREHYDTREWNPLGEIIKPGDTIAIKPNFVKHDNPNVDFNCLVTQGCIIRAVCDYVYIALQGRGRIVIADAPIQSADFEQLAERTGVNAIRSFYGTHSALPVDLIDVRLETGVRDRSGIVRRSKRNGDPSGYAAIDLGNKSALLDIQKDYDKFRVTNYDKSKMVEHHSRTKNEYIIARSVLQADLIINLPKLKTHRKAGMTCALKNMIGINGTKDCLPHHRVGSITEGGDEYLYPSLRKRIITRLYEKMDVAQKGCQSQLIRLLHRIMRGTEILWKYRDPFFEGSWYGNDTIPRTITDINKIALYADKNGVMQETVQRKMFIIVDGLLAGEEEGPLYPTAKSCGLLVAGQNPVAVDLVCSRLMYFDYRKIPVFTYSTRSGSFPLFDSSPDRIKIMSADCSTFSELLGKGPSPFRPAKGWAGHIEYRPEQQQP